MILKQSKLDDIRIEIYNIVQKHCPKNVVNAYTEAYFSILIKAIAKIEIPKNKPEYSNTICVDAGPLFDYIDIDFNDIILSETEIFRNKDSETPCMKCWYIDITEKEEKLCCLYNNIELGIDKVSYFEERKSTKEICNKYIMLTQNQTFKCEK